MNLGQPRDTKGIPPTITSIIKRALRDCKRIDCFRWKSSFSEVVDSLDHVTAPGRRQNHADLEEFQYRNRSNSEQNWNCLQAFLYLLSWVYTVNILTNCNSKQSRPLLGNRSRRFEGWCVSKHHHILHFIVGCTKKTCSKYFIDVSWFLLVPG